MVAYEYNKNEERYHHVRNKLGQNSINPKQILINFSALTDFRKSHEPARDKSCIQEKQVGMHCIIFKFDKEHTANLQFFSN